MITFVELGSLGRLGNQLFQYAALRALSLKGGYEVKIPDPMTKVWHGQSCLLNNFNIEATYLEPSDTQTLQNLYHEPDYMNFDPNFWNLPDNTNISGFFQSTYYFNLFEEQIRRELTPKKHFVDEAVEKMAKIKETCPGYDVVSVHMRRGDNTNNTNASRELNEMYGLNGMLDSSSFYGEYFNSATKQFKDKKVKFLIFTGGSRDPHVDNVADIDWCKKNFRGDEYLFAERNTALQDFCLIMQCKYNIISHVSSFGWWAAFLNNNCEKQVVAPYHYHSNLKNYTHREGFFPTDWILV
jgi:hypothetical protein|tara:strand:+ start:8294 stop:9184 length:891 start_codon:yes stop_codon:yes gene_type:complete